VAVLGDPPPTPMRHFALDDLGAIHAFILARTRSTPPPDTTAI
jgi:hypothetical protein